MCIRKPGSGVDLDDHAPLFFQRASDVRGHDVDAGNIEADDPRRFDRAGRDLPDERDR